MSSDRHDKAPKSLGVELRFFEGLLRRRPNDKLILKAIGDLYTQAGRHQSGLEVDLQLCRICPEDSEVWYNLGCSYALVGRKDESFDALFRAVDLGYRDGRWMMNDTDLSSLHEDPRFEFLVDKASSQ